MYNLLKIPAGLALNFYCRKVTINKRYLLQNNGPLLIAANHPNSFLDAIIIATLFKNPVYALARGDVFANKIYTRLLGLLNMMPVYRMSEGTENLEENYTTFAACQDIFKKDGIVLIFSEGRCINEWHLRKLKKGTARLAINAWKHNIPLKVLPLGINYSSFKFFGKNVILNFGEIITQKDMPPDVANGRNLLSFNLKLEEQLKNLVVEIHPGDKQKIARIFVVPQPLIKKILLFIPSTLGWLLHFPIYYSVVGFLRKRANDHFDSIVVGLLFILYPFYILVLTTVLFLVTKNTLSLLLVLLLPFTAWCHLQLKKQINSS